jgi:hypothetical protein
MLLNDVRDALQRMDPFGSRPSKPGSASGFIFGYKREKSRE